MKSQDIAIIGVMLAIGAIARIAANFIPGPIVSNLVIAFYCLAIMLVVPRFSEALGIGLVAGIICALISHSLFPPANLISEPIGALACIGVFIAMKNRTVFAPAIATFVATLASGLSFIGIVMALYMFAPTYLYNAFPAESLIGFFIMMFTIVITTSVINTIVAQILYIPAARVLSRGR